MRRFIAVAMVCAGLAAAAETTSPPVMRITPTPIARVEVLKKAQTIRRADLFAGPGKATNKRKTLPPDTIVYVTGEEKGPWTEVWAEDVGLSWISRSNIQIFESDTK